MADADEEVIDHIEYDMDCISGYLFYMAILYFLAIVISIDVGFR